MYKSEEKIGFASDTDKYNYGELDYKGDIWNINEVDNYFDNIICTEVFEHIPYPIETVKEFSRLLKPGGKLILTAPSNCLRHMDPYFFYTGFSDNWFDKILKEYDFKLKKIEIVGDYYSWMKVEIYRTMSNHSLLSKILLFPTFLFFKSMKKTQMMPPLEKIKLVDMQGSEVSIARKCRMVNISRSHLYYTPKGIPSEELEMLRIFDKFYKMNSNYRSIA